MSKHKVAFSQNASKAYTYRDGGLHQVDAWPGDTYETTFGDVYRMTSLGTWEPMHTKSVRLVRSA